jgi:CheY-like chemotaxis protein
MLNIAICDDEKNICDYIEKRTVECLAKADEEADIKVFYDGAELLQNCRENPSGFDIIFLDIKMKTINGVECAKLLREAGAKEVHMRVAAPPYLYPCYFGTDVGSTSELIAVGKTVEEMRDIIGVDSLDFITLENILKSPIGSKTEFCTACFNGDYPLDVSEFTTKDENKSFIKNWEK